MNSEYLAEGGTPITAQLAMELRQLVFGSAAIPMRAEWTQTAFTFGTPKEQLSYGLRSPRNATRGLLSVVQGFILKHLLFGPKIRHVGGSSQDPLCITADMQKTALISAMVEILRIVSDKGKVIMVLPSPQDEPFVTHSVTYFHDSITEQLYVFTLDPHDELEFFIKRHLNRFIEADGPGTLLFLYSAVLTRTMRKVRTDLDSTKTVPLTMIHNEEGSLMILTLLLTGRATPHIHNGVINVGDEKSYATPQYGVLSRCTIGLLLWDNEGVKFSAIVARQPGSRLKTPNHPIWITSCAGHFGVLFSRNAELLRNYHAESRFDVTYYSCSGHQIAMTIDNRSLNDHSFGMLERQVSVTAESSSSSSSTLSGRGIRDELQGNGADVVAKVEETTLNTPLQRLIHTKWEEAAIRFHAQPSMLSYLFGTNQ